MLKFARLCACLASFVAAGVAYADPGPMSIWYSNAPASIATAQTWWHEALPVGNGKLGATVFGGITSETIQFNEDTIWTGQPHYSDNTNSTPAHLASIRAACNSAGGGNPLTEATTYIMSLPPREASYQDAGSIILSLPATGTTSNYLRSLNLATATVNVHYDANNITYNRDIFASAPSNKVIAIHFTASQAGKITFNCTMTSQQTATLSTQGSDLVMHTKVSGVSEALYTAGGLTNAIKYDARIRVIANGGTVTMGANSIGVTNCDDVTLLLAVASNYKTYNDITADYVNICSNNIVNAAALAYADLRQAQQNDYQNLFNRVVLDLGTNPRTNQTTGFRKVNAVDGKDLQLLALDFQLGRYLTIASSRPGSQAMNLQGKWNPLIDLGNQWDSKMTLNINEEMNYWGTEVANLSECTLPLMDLVADLAVTGHRAAGTNYFCDGWVAHHNTDLWRDASAINGNDGIWPTGGAWLCQHVWWHYLYTGDTNWLATTGYPMLRDASKFFTNFLFTSFNGYKVTGPSYSPEHSVNNGSNPNCVGPTMDNELLRDLFSHTIAAAQTLGIDASFVTAVSNIQRQLPPDQIGSKGQLEEWLGLDEGTTDSGHRHCSHLVGFYPGDQISAYYTPTNAAGAAVSVGFRGWGNSGLTPWSCAVRANLRARLQDGDGALTNLFFIYGYNKTSTNLIYGDNHDQVDSVFGRLSAIAGLFLQCPREEIILLPALPSLATNGMVSGLCAANGFEVDNMTWTNGNLTGATILSKLGKTCNLRSRWPIDVKLGATNISAPMIAPGLYQFTTLAGSNYTIVPAIVTETDQAAPIGMTAGRTATVVTNAAFSNFRGQVFGATGASDFVSYGVSNVVAGTYNIRVVADAGNNRGQFQLSVGPIGGSLANVGSAQDTYSATNLCYLVTSHFNRSANGTPLVVSPTNAAVLWTNQLTEFDCSTWTAPANGNYEFRFTVTGKNAGSSGFVISPDFIKLTPSVPAGPPDNPPTDVALDNASVLENQPSGTAVGVLSTTDPDAGETFTYSLVSGTGSAGNSSFTISGSNLLTSASFNYEAQGSYSIRVRTTDSASQSFDKVFTITVVDANDAPTGISLSNTNVAENLPSGTTVGTLGSSDQDAGDTFTYNLVNGFGSTDNGSFAIVGNTLQTAASFDFETQTSYIIRVQTMDAAGATFERNFVIFVQNVNEQPTNISLSNASVYENLPANTTVGSFSSSDPDAGNTFSYSLVTGTGSTDNGSFAIVGNTLRTAASFDYETQSSYSVRVQTMDQGGLSYEKVFTINVLDTNDPPTDITLSTNAVVESQPSGTAVATLDSVDPNLGDTFTYTLVSGTGSDDNATFTITNSVLYTAAVLDFETQTNYNIRIRSTDQGGQFFEKQFVINVLDGNDPPTDIALDSATVPENEVADTAVGTFTTTDPNLGDTFTYSLVAGTGGTDNGSFTISGDILETADTFNFEAQNSYSIRVRATDQGGLSFDKVFTVTITDVNEVPAAPTNVSPTNNASGQSQTLTLQSSAFSDVDAGDSHSASEWIIQRVSDSSVVYDSGTNTVNKTSLAVPPGTLDFMTAYSWQVRHADSQGLWSGYSASTTFTTIAPTLGLMSQGGQVILWWPLPSTGFSLQYNTNLATPSWNPILTPPTAWGGFNWVTNTPDMGGTYYRLSK